MRDLYKEGYIDATREVDSALTSALHRTKDPLEQMNLIIAHLHSMNLRANTKTAIDDDVTFDDFLQNTGIAYVLKGGK